MSSRLSTPLAIEVRMPKKRQTNAAVWVCDVDALPRQAVYHPPRSPTMTAGRFPQEAEEHHHKLRFIEPPSSRQGVGVVQTTTRSGDFRFRAASSNRETHGYRGAWYLGNRPMAKRRRKKSRSEKNWMDCLTEGVKRVWSGRFDR